MNINYIHPADQLVMFMQRIYDKGMTTTSGGNLSIMDDDGNIWITPAGVDKGTLNRNDIVCVKPDGTVVGEVPLDGSLRKFAITVDALTGMTYGYAENVETGAMERTSESMIKLSASYLNRQEKYLEDPVTNADLACYENIYSFFTKSGKLEPLWEFGSGSGTNATLESASIEIDGIMTPLKTVDSEGKEFFNMEAVKAYAEQNFSFLLDDFSLIMGYVYE